MSALAQRDATVKLSNQHEWATWYSQLQSRCVAYKIWDNVKEENNVPFLINPVMPVRPLTTNYAVPQSNPLAPQPSQLSEGGLKSFKEDMEYYKVIKEDYKTALHQYEIQEQGVQHVTQLIQSTVAPHLQRVCCLPELSLRQWLANLKQTVGVDDRIEKEQARERYQSSLKPMRNTNNWDIWLAEYDRATTEAEINKVMGVSDIDNITKDFLVAVNKAAPI